MISLQDLRFALRTLIKNRWVTVLAVTSLALAIGGNTAVYSLINTFLFRPIPYENVHRLVMIGENNDELLQGQLTTTSAANYLDFKEQATSFESMAAFQASAFAFGGGDDSEQLTVGEVTPEFFEVLGVRSAWGRNFLPEEGVRGQGKVAILSHAFWTERFSNSPDLREATVELDGELYDVVGVTEKSFEWILQPNADVWVPLPLERDAAPRQRRDLFAVARLADGVSEESAQAEMDTLLARLAKEFPVANRGYAVELLNLRYDFPDARNKLFFRLIQVALIFVLLIACANIANLLLSRSQAREREIAVRNSIGATRRRIIGQLFTESLLMAALAGVLGIALGYAGMKLIGNAFAAFLPTFWIPTLDARVLAYTVGVTLFGGILFGLAPVIQTSRFDLLAALKDGNQGATNSSKRRLASNSLVVLEIAFALAFLAGASMMISTFQTMQTSDAGFDTDNVLVMQVDLPDSRYSESELQVAGMETLSERLRAIPGVRSAFASDFFPRMPFLVDQSFEIEGQPVDDEQALPRAAVLTAGTGFFEALGIPLQQGRAFQDGDDAAAAPVAVVSAAMAERFWPGGSALGQRFEMNGRTREIVGVVKTVQHDVLVRNDDRAVIYLPWKQQPNNTFAMVLKTDVDAGSLSEDARREIRGFDRAASVTQLQTLDAFVEQFWVGQNVFTSILFGFGILALVLAAVGTYGVLAYSVVRRTHEIGIRMAIGAGRDSILRMIVRQGLVLAVIGIAVGVPLIWYELKILAQVFAGFVPVEPTSVLGVALLLIVVTVAASALPAWRAARIDPLDALRSE